MKQPNLFEVWYKNHVSDIKGRLSQIPELKKRMREFEIKTGLSMYVDQLGQLEVMRSIAKKIGREGNK